MTLNTKNGLKQTTYGTETSRTQSCASVVHDPEASSWQIFVVSGAGFESKDIVTDVYASPTFLPLPHSPSRIARTCPSPPSDDSAPEF